MVYIMKKDSGTKEPFNADKIVRAVNKSAREDLVRSSRMKKLHSS